MLGRYNFTTLSRGHESSRINRLITDPHTVRDMKAFAKSIFEQLIDNDVSSQHTRNKSLCNNNNNNNNKHRSSLGDTSS